MAFGRDNDQDKADAAAMRHRRAKQKGYQRNYRRKLDLLGIPERPDYGDIALDSLIEFIATKGGGQLNAIGFGNLFYKNLVARRFDPIRAMAQFNRMVERCKAENEREQRSAALEADYQARMGDPARTDVMSERAISVSTILSPPRSRRRSRRFRHANRQTRQSIRFADGGPQ